MTPLVQPTKCKAPSHLQVGQSWYRVSLTVKKPESSLLGEEVVGGREVRQNSSLDTPPSQNIIDKKVLGFRTRQEQRIVYMYSMISDMMKVNTCELTSILRIMSRGPIISGSYLMWALLVARATELYNMPLVFMRVDSILWTHEAHVIPLTCEIQIVACFSCFFF